MSNTQDRVEIASETRKGVSVASKTGLLDGGSDANKENLRHLQQAGFRSVTSAFATLQTLPRASMPVIIIDDDQPIDAFDSLDAPASIDASQDSGVKGADGALFKKNTAIAMPINKAGVGGESLQGLLAIPGACSCCLHGSAQCAICNTQEHLAPSLKALSRLQRWICSLTTSEDESPP